jgi:hypothetical protein
VQRVLGLPLLEVKPDRQRLARYGVPAEEVLQVVEASRVGVDAGRIFEGPRRFELKILLPPGQQSVEALGELQVGTQLIPLEWGGQFENFERDGARRKANQTGWPGAPPPLDGEGCWRR